jgi:2-polyprenyl-3-methyl-5-hydroxy-6-metoxy-1,4-benzoquinol methylase
MNTRAELWAGLHHQNPLKIDQHYSEAFQKIAFGDFLRILRPYRQTGQLLDVGCSIGGFLSAANRAGWVEHGIDISPSVDVARQAGLRVERGRLEEVDFPPAAFDVITMIDVIEHINHLDGLMKRIRTLLRPHGALLVVTPNLTSLNSRLLRQRWTAIEPDDHLVLFTPHTLARLFGQYGFSLKKVSTYDANPLELKVIFSPQKDIQRRVEGQKSNRRLIGSLMRSRTLQTARRLANQVLDDTKLGERLIALAELSTTQ